MLATVALTDELWSGIAVVAAPALERELDLDHGAYALAVFTVPLLVGAAGEALLAILSDRYPRRYFVAGGVAALAASLLVAGLTRSAWGLSTGLALAGVASGVACSAAQAELVTRTSPERALTRWTVFASAGDVLGPAVVSATLWRGHSYRFVFVFVGACLALQAVVMFRALGGSPPTGSRDDEAEAEAEAGDDDAAPEPLGEIFRSGARSSRIWIWLGAAALCTLLDEIAAALAALHLRAAHGLPEAEASACLAFFSIGSLFGALVADRWLARWSWRVVLVGACVAAVAAVGLFLAAPGPGLASAALALLGAAVAPHYPLVKAQAYAAMPGRPGLVNAAAQVFVVVDLLAPPALGVLAEAHGTAISVLALTAQPLGILVLVGLFSRRRAGTT